MTDYDIGLAVSFALGMLVGAPVFLWFAAVIGVRIMSGIWDWFGARGRMQRRANVVRLRQKDGA